MKVQIIIFFWYVEGEVGELVQPGDKRTTWKKALPFGISGRKLCMLPCNWFHIWGIWSSKELGDALQSSFGMTTRARKGDSFYMEGRFSLYNTAAFKLYYKSYWVLHTSFHYITAFLPGLVLLRLPMSEVRFKIS